MNSSLSKRDQYLNIANYFTFARVALIPIVMLLMGFQEPHENSNFHPVLAYFTALFFVLSGISDLIDGYFARRMKVVSTFGKLLDPLADKLMVMAVFIMLIPLKEVPAWIVVVFLFREITITALRGVAATEGIVIAADVWGKKKTALQNVTLTCFLLPPVFLTMNSRVVGWFFLILALIVSLGSGINYSVKFFKDVFKKE